MTVKKTIQFKALQSDIDPQKHYFLGTQTVIKEIIGNIAKKKSGQMLHDKRL